MTARNPGGLRRRDPSAKEAALPGPDRDAHPPVEAAATEWTAFALLAAGEHGGGGHVEDEELALQVARLLDRMVREAQHRGLAFDEDED